jgi:hypothetical protein
MSVEMHLANDLASLTMLGAEEIIFQETLLHEILFHLRPVRRGHQNEGLKTYV